MDTLPDCIIDEIYKQKHKLEMKDVCSQIEKYQSWKVDQAYMLLREMYKDYHYFIYNPEAIAEIWTALRNEAYITDNQLWNYISDLKDNILNHIDFYDNDVMIIDEDYFIYNHFITLDYVIYK